METIKTTEDGWDCEPLLQEAVELLDEIEPHIYEIKRCQREQELEFMVEEMKEKLQEAIDVLEQIDTDVEYETVEDYD